MALRLRLMAINETHGEESDDDGGRKTEPFFKPELPISDGHRVANEGDSLDTECCVAAGAWLKIRRVPPMGVGSPKRSSESFASTSATFQCSALT